MKYKIPGIWNTKYVYDEPRGCFWLRSLSTTLAFMEIWIAFLWNTCNIQNMFKLTARMLVAAQFMANSCFYETSKSAQIRLWQGLLQEWNGRTKWLELFDAGQNLWDTAIWGDLDYQESDFEDEVEKELEDEEDCT